MKLVFIGSSGHWQFALDAMRQDARICAVAIASGCAEESMAGLEKAMPNAAVYQDWRVMLSQVEADVAIVASWFAYNAEIAMACLSHGMDVYCEKPLATTHEQLALLEDTWRASGHALGGMFNYRCSAWFRTMQSAVDEGFIGEVRQIHAQKSYRMGVRPAFYKERTLMGGLIPWVAIHAIDWACAFGGKCDWVSASHSCIGNRGNGDMEVSSAILMGMENGVMATVTADFFRPDGSARHDDDRLRLTGTRGMIEVIDGQVTLENEHAKRNLSLVDEKNAFLDFMEAVYAGNSEKYSLAALYATRISLYARDSADHAGMRIEHS